MEIVLGILLGFLAGMVLCVRFVRQEIAAKLGPRLDDIERQVHSLRQEVALDSATRMAAMGRRLDEGGR